MSKKTRKWSGKSRAYRLRKQYVYDDRLRGRETRISAEEIKEIIALPCYYCGEVERPRGLDRKDHRIGHVESNVVGSCLRCNHKRGRWKGVEEMVRRNGGVFKCGLELESSTWNRE